MSEDNKDLDFLPYLLNEELYLIEPIARPIMTQEKEVIRAEPPPEIIQIRNEEKTAPKPEPKEEKIKKKVLILVGYLGVDLVPLPVKESLIKIFEALKVPFSEVEIINVLSPISKPLEKYEFSYLIFMGGNGKNLPFMKDFTGTRNRYDIAKHAGVSIFFAEGMDIYFKDIELKKKFWSKLKELFDIK